MSSVMEIETAIQKLSMTEQRIIARRLGERLVDGKYAGRCAAPEEGIPFLAQYASFPAPPASRGRTLRPRAKALR